MIAALHALRQKKPLELVCAVPMAPPDVQKYARKGKSGRVLVIAIGFHCSWSVLSQISH